MGKSKSETKQQQTVTPTNPAFVTRAVQDQQQRINQLGQRDPREFVAPASQLQNAAFSLGGGLANRMGAGVSEGLLATTAMRTQPIGAPEPVSVSNLSFQGAPPSWAQQGGSSSLTASPFGAMRPEASGMIAASDIGQPDYGEYVRSQPDLQAEYNRIQNGGFGPNLPASYDINGDGRLQIGEYGRFHNERFGVNEPQRTPPPTIGAMPVAQSSQPLQARDPVTGAAIGQVGPADLTSPNPNDMFAGAGLLAADVGMSGANTVGDVTLSQAGQLGPAQGYRASGPAGIERANAAQGQSSGRADVASANAAQANVTGPAGIERANAAQGQSSGRAAVERANAAQASASGPAGVERAQASLLGDAQGYDAALADAVSAGLAPQVSLSGYDAATGQAVTGQATTGRAATGRASTGQAATGRASLIGDLPTMQAAQIGQTDIDRFMNPYLDDVVNATQADMQEQFGQQRAALDARAAGAGAFGGSRFGVREAQLDGEQSRALGSTLGGLRADGFNTALTFADRDVGRRQDANAANFNLQGQRAFANAEAQNRFGLANMDAQNRFGLANMDAQNQFGLANMSAENQFGLANMDARNQFGLANMDAQNQFGLANMAAENQAAAFGADASNRGLLANQDAAATFALADQDAAMRAGLTNAGLLSDANRFGAEAANEFARLNQQAAQQVGLANAEAQNRSALDFAGRADAMSMANADARTRAALANAGFENDALMDAARRADAMSLANMDSRNQVGLANANAANRSLLDFAGRSDAVGLANADARTRAALANAGFANDASIDAARRADAMSMANMDSLNQVGLANADAANRSLLDFAGRADSAGQFNAGAMNQFGLAQFDADTQANFRNADAMNLTNRFNAGQRDTALARRLQAAGLLGDLGATVGAEDRANIGLLAGLGEQQREIDRAYRNAEPTMAQLLGNLTAQQQFALFRGENSNTNRTTTERGSTLDQIGQAVGIASALGGMMPGGGGAKGKVGIF